jgi:hypothetical protein
METVQQQPQMSLLEQRRSEAMEEALKSIETISQESNVDLLSASKLFLETVRQENKYHLEEAVAKLVEYFEIKSDLITRESELKRWSPEVVTILEHTKALASNDEKYLVAA